MLSRSRHDDCIKRFGVWPGSGRFLCVRADTDIAGLVDPVQINVVNVMQPHNKNRHRSAPRVEALEGKTLLSAGLMGQHAAPHAMTAAALAHAAVSFSGTLAGVYSNVHIPFAGYLLSYSTSGTLTGIGSAHLHSSIFARPSARARRALGQFIVRNAGGSMTMNVSTSATTGTYSYKVIRATGVDASYKGGTGVVTITQNPTHSFPYYVSGLATMTFTPG
jgi:hypothetical protein